VRGKRGVRDEDLPADS